MKSVYDAITEAADYIEKHPRAYDFCQPSVSSLHPHVAWVTGCPLVWIGRFSGAPQSLAFTVAHHVLGCSEQDFFHRMDNLHGASWRYYAADAAVALRAYAVKHHPQVIVP